MPCSGEAPLAELPCALDFCREKSACKIAGRVSRAHGLEAFETGVDIPARA